MKYIFISNNLNSVIDFNKLSSYEQNLLIGIFGRLNNTEEISLRADEVRKYCSNKSNFTYKEAEETAISLCKKIDKIRKLFDVFQVDYADSDNKEFDGMWIKLWKSHTHLFKYMKYGFTILDFEEFKEIKSCYTKTLYRLLSQFRTTGIVNVSYEWLVEQFGCKYKDYFEINQKILSPSLDRLTKYFKNLTMSVNKGRVNGKYGCISIVFKFDKTKLPKLDTYIKPYSHIYYNYEIEGDVYA